MTTFTSQDIEDLKTDWFPADIDPVNEGEYEVQVKTWPWEFRCEWSNEHGWLLDQGVTIVQWRGLKEKIE